MRGLTLDGVRDVRYRDDLPDPELAAAGDVIVEVRRAGLCGSDLHPYFGREAIGWGTIPGHEVVGRIAACGADVQKFAVGDQVIVPFSLSCGSCQPCERGLTSRCVSSQLLGWRDGLTGAGLHGGQASQVRVPLADGSLVRVPDGVTVDEAVLLCDNFPAGWYAAERAGVSRGDHVAVVGAGAVGLCAITAAFALGAATVSAFDPVEARLNGAAGLGAEVGEGADLRGRCDAVIDAAGPAAAQRLAYDLIRPGGTISLIAVQTDATFSISPGEAYDKNVTIRAGRAPVRAVLDRVLPKISPEGLAQLAGAVITHPALSLTDGPDVYARFAAREDGFIKATFEP